jgi:biopolymer transport protein TolQ
MWIQSQLDFLVLLKNTGPVAKAVLVTLLVFSIWSWGIIISKVLLLRRVARESETFWKIFHKGRTLSEIATACEALRLQPSPEKTSSALTAKPALTATLTQANTTSLQRTMQRAAASELTALEHRLIFLATTASVAPFIGLFGTVWGVLTSFMGLSNADTASLKAVGPGIAEALIATAFGLLAAIPAVVAYNFFVNNIRNIGGQLDELQSDLLAIAEANGR